MRRARRPAWLLCLAIALPARAGTDPLLKYHPQEGDLPDLKVLEGSHQSGAGEGLTQIYDGGYGRYTKAGVTRASQRYYRLGDRTIEVVIHEVKSEKAARKLFESFCQDTAAPVEPITHGRRVGKVCAAAAEGSAYAYQTLGRYFLASSVDKPDPGAARRLLTVAGERIVGQRKPAAAKSGPKP
jgi:hypothetical protein